MELVCIVCPNSCKLTVTDGEVTGNKCPRGKIRVGRNDLPDAHRLHHGEDGFEDRPVLPVRTSADIPKDKMADCMKIANSVVLSRRVKRGEVIVANLFGTGVNLVSSSDMSE